MSRPGSASRAHLAGAVAGSGLDGRFAGAILAALALSAGIVWAVARWVAIPWTVQGDSMSPTLEPGDRVVVELTTYRRRIPRPGEVAVFLGPGDVPFVKRVWRVNTGAPGDGSLGFGSSLIEVAGDNPGSSLDSRSFGPVSGDRFVGRVVFRFWPLARMERIQDDFSGSEKARPESAGLRLPRR